jgi:hypothetical protein
MKPPHATSLLCAAGAGTRSLGFEAGAGGLCPPAGSPVCALAGAANEAQNRSTKASILQKLKGLLLGTGISFSLCRIKGRPDCRRAFVRL